MLKSGKDILRNYTNLKHTSQTFLKRSSVLCNSSKNCSNRRSVLTVGDYDSVYRNSIERKLEFWDELGQQITWHKPYDKVLDPDSSPSSPKWFSGGELNTCYNALDRHVANGLGEKVAIIHDSPITESKSTTTFNELLDQVSKLAGVFINNGVKKGDRVLVYMPMIVETVVAMLACTRIGAIHSVVFGGFASLQLSTRIDHLKPKLVVLASCGVEPSRILEYKPLVDEAIRISSHKPKNCLVLQRKKLPAATMTPGQDLDWNEEMDRSTGHDPVPVGSDHPCYVLYTSGTTGNPKGIVRPSGGHAVILPWTLGAIYGMEQEDVWWAASDLGWVVGHSYICYGPLLNGNTTVLFEGKPVGTPDTKQFYRVIEEHKVKGMFTAPTALRAIKQADPDASLSDKAILESIFVAGEPLDQDTRAWSENSFKVPVLNNFWQTETGFPITAHCAGLNMKDKYPPKGSTGKAVMGFDIHFLPAEKGEAGDLGRIVCKSPLPPGCFNTLYNSHDRYEEAYFSEYPGYYDTMDAGIKDKDGYISVLSREDDIINVAGHRLSTLALEEALLEHEEVIDAVVIGVPDEIKGLVPLGLVVSKSSNRGDSLVEELVKLVRTRIGPVAAFRQCAIVRALPKTRSGKTPRGSIAKLANDEKVTIPPTIEDANVYADIHKALKSCGYAKNVETPTL